MSKLTNVTQQEIEDYFHGFPPGTKITDLFEVGDSVEWLELLGIEDSSGELIWKHPSGVIVSIVKSTAYIDMAFENQEPRMIHKSLYDLKVIESTGGE